MPFLCPVPVLPSHVPPPNLESLGLGVGDVPARVDSWEHSPTHFRSLRQEERWLWLCSSLWHFLKLGDVHYIL